MSLNDLKVLLFRIRDSEASASDVRRARELVQVEPSLPEELRQIIDFTDPEADAAGILAVLGEDDLFGEALRVGLAEEIAAATEAERTNRGAEAELSESPDRQEEEWAVLGHQVAAAVRAEAGGIERVSEVLAVTLPGKSIPVGAAVRHAAGQVELSSNVGHALGHPPHTVEIAEAVRREAREVEIAGSVLQELGLYRSRAPVATAVKTLAGHVDLVHAIEHDLTDIQLPVAAAVRAEAATIEVVDAIIQVVGGEPRVALREAIHDEAGQVQIWAEIETVVSDAWISAMLDHELTGAAHRAAVYRLRLEPEAGALMTLFAGLRRSIRAAITDAAGETPYLWEGIAAQIGVDGEEVLGWDGQALVEAVHDEAGVVEIAGLVMDQLTGLRAVHVPCSRGEIPQIPEPANNLRWGNSIALAILAAAFLLLAAPQMWANQTGGEQVVVAEDPVQFASAGEIVVEDLDYGDNANVYQAMGDAGALILWVDEGATL